MIPPYLGYYLYTWLSMVIKFNKVRHGRILFPILCSSFLSPPHPQFSWNGHRGGFTPWRRLLPKYSRYRVTESDRTLVSNCSWCRCPSFQPKLAFLCLTFLFLLQIGGSLIKVVYFSRESISTSKGGGLKFVKFETENIDESIDFIANLLTTSRQQKSVIKTTGGGSHKYHDVFEQKLKNVTIEKEDEMDCLIAGGFTLEFRITLYLRRILFVFNITLGLNFLIAEIPYETFTYTKSNQMCFEERSNTRFPYMVYILKYSFFDQTLL